MTLDVPRHLRAVMRSAWLSRLWSLRLQTSYGLFTYTSWRGLLSKDPRIR